MSATQLLPSRTSRDIILRPIISEKTVTAVGESNWYTFEVDTKANKVEIRQAVEEIFKVAVLSVNTLNVKGKPKRWGRRYHGHKSDWKKAMVKLKEGDKIEIAGMNLFEQ